MKSFEEVLASKSGNQQPSVSSSSFRTDSNKSFEQVIAERAQSGIINDYNALLGEAAKGIHLTPDLISRANSIKISLNRYSKYYDSDFVSQMTSGLDSLRAQGEAEKQKKKQAKLTYGMNLIKKIEDDNEDDVSAILENSKRIKQGRADASKVADIDSSKKVSLPKVKDPFTALSEAYDKAYENEAFEVDGKIYYNTYAWGKDNQAREKNEIEVGVRNFENFALVSDKMSKTPASKEMQSNIGADIKIHNVINGFEEVDYSSPYAKFMFLTDTEKGTYNYLASLKNVDMVKKYLKLIDTDITQKAKQIQAENMNIFEKGANVAGSSFLSGVESIAKSGIRLQGNDSRLMDFAYDPSESQMLSSAIINSEDNKFFKGIFNVISSVSSQAPALAFGAITGGAGYSAILGMQITSDSMADAAQNNKPIFAGVTYGLAQTALELSLERLLGGIAAKISGGSNSRFVSKMFNKVDDVVKNAKIAKLFKAGISLTETGAGEFGQEFLQALTDLTMRNMIYKENNTYSEDVLLDALYQGVIGFFSGQIMGITSVNTVIANTQYENIGESLYAKDVLDLCEKVGYVKEETYLKVKKAFENGKKVDNVDLGRLSVEVTQDIYNNTHFTEEYLKAFADNATVKEAAELMFGGNMEAAQIFKDKYSDPNYLTENNKNTADNDGVKYSASNETSVKQQLQAYSNQFAEMQPVADLDVTEDLKYKEETVNWALKIFEKLGFKVNRAGLGDIIIDRKRISNGYKYLKTVEEKRAYAAVPAVLENGIEVGEHLRHKERPYDTVTIAAPITLNGQRYNMAVVVRKDGKNYYKVHRIVMPNGKSIIFENKEDGAGMAATSSSYDEIGSPTDTVSNNTVPQSEQSVNNNSMQGEEEYTPSGRALDVRALGVRGQNYVKSVGKDLGVTVEFVNMEKELKRRGKTFPEDKKMPDGFFDKKTNTVYINYTAERPMEFLLKHELTHYIEQAGFDYFDFQNTVFASQAFKNWLKAKGYDSQGAYNKDIIATYSPFTDMNEEKANREIVANFVGEMLFGGEGKLSENFRNALEPKKRGPIGEIIHRLIEWLKARLPGTHKLYTELEAIEQQWLNVFREVNAAPKENTATQDGEVEFSIVNLDTGKSYVQASRRIIHGDNVAEWRSQISQFFNRSLKNGPIRIKTVEGDVLTISKDTANKARDRNVTENGQTRRLSDKEFYVKLKAEAHIDELAELSTKNNYNPIHDTKNHNIAKDGFTYRTVYFQDSDESYYRITLSVGENGGVSTVYNVGKIKADNVPNGNIVSAIGSKADTLSANYSIPTSPEFVNNNSDDGLQFSYDNGDSSQKTVLTRLKNGEISVEEAESLLSKEKLHNPVEIANLTYEDAKTTPHHNRRTGDGHGDKQSKFYGSAMESRLVADDLETEITDDEYVKHYKSITNRETLNKAAKELAEGGQARANKFFRLPPDRASAVDVAVGFILLKRYQDAGDFESATLVAQTLRSFGTAAGQTVQIFSILQTFTPDMMAEYAEKEMETAYEKMADLMGKKWVDKRAAQFKLTKEDIDFIRTHTLQAALMPDGSRQKAIILGEICARLQDKIPTESGQSIRALQRISMLLNVKTNVRNILGNASMAGVYVASDFFGNMLDARIAQKSGVRTTGNIHLKGSGTAFKKGVNETWDDFKRGIRTKQEELNRFNVNRGGGKIFNEHHEGKFAKQLNAVAKKLNEIDNFTSMCLEIGDRPFFEMWMNNSLNNQMRLNGVTTPTPEMLEIAKEEALQRTWQDDNVMSRAVSSIKRSMNKVHLPGTTYGLGDFILKFVKTPSNIAKAIVEFSPAGFAIAAKKGADFNYALQTGSFTPQMQKEYVRSMSNAITGTLIYVLVAAAAGLGAITISGAGDDDKDVSNFEKYVVGVPPYSIKLFGQDVTYDWNQPFGSVLATVADFMDGRKENPNGSVFKDMVLAFKTGATVFTQQSFLQSLYELFSSDGIVEAITSAALSEPAAFIPQVSSQLASFLDENRRTTYDPSSEFMTAINRVLIKLPGLRTLLPEQVNVLGETSRNVQYLSWEAFAAPGNRYPKSSGYVAEAIYELYKETGDVTVMPHAAPNYITVKGNKIQFNGSQKMDYQRIMGTTSAEILSKMLSSAEFKKLDDSQKVKAVSEVYAYSTAIAKSSLEYDYATLSAMVGNNSNGVAILKEDAYNRLGKQGTKRLAKEYFLTKTELNLGDNAEKIAAFFIKKSRQ